MTSTVFVDKQTVIEATWLNDVNAKTYHDDASLLPYTPAGTDAVPTNVQDKLRESVSVKDFKCDDGLPVQGDGSHDDTTGIQAAFSALPQRSDNFSLVINGANQGFNVGCVGTVNFPRGNYRVSGEILTGAYTRIIGDHATIRSTNNAAHIFNVYGFETHIEGISFAGGLSAINYRQANDDTSINSITNCQFNAQNGYSIQSVGTYSTKLNISDCKFAVFAGALFSECDECTFETSWIQAYAPNIAYIKNHGSMTCSDLLLVPIINGTTAQALTTYWIQNGNADTFQGGYTACYRVRFGGEAGGIAIGVNYAAQAISNQITRGFVFDTCGIWGSNSILRLVNIPDFVISTNTDLSVGGNPRLIVDSDLSTLTNSPLISLDFIQTQKQESVLIRPHATVYGTSEQNLLNTNTYFAGAATSGNNGVGGSQALTSELPIYGYLWQETFGSDNGSQLYRTYAYTGLSISSGWYTASVVVKATKDIMVSLGTEGLGANKQIHVPGDGNFHTVAWQFYNPGGLSSTFFALYNMRTDGVVVTWGDPKLVSGFVPIPAPGYHGAGINSEIVNINGNLYSTVIPSTGYWYRGATVFSLNPTAGGNIGWVCVSTGASGTWKTFGAISA